MRDAEGHAAGNRNSHRYFRKLHGHTPNQEEWWGQGMCIRHKLPCRWVGKSRWENGGEGKTCGSAFLEMKPPLTESYRQREHPKLTRTRSLRGPKCQEIG